MSAPTLLGPTEPAFRREYPRDTALRKALLPHASHGAKLNLYLLDHILDKYVPPGRRFIDPMAGCGSALYGAVRGRLVGLLELEHKHHAQIVRNVAHLSEMHYRGELATYERIAWHPRTLAPPYIVHAQGNAADWQGFPTAIIDTGYRHKEPPAIVFSPPYGDTAARERNKEPATAKRAAVPGWVRDRTDPSLHVDRYGTEFFQIGNMGFGQHIRAMGIVYRNCAIALPSGGIMVVVTADFWRGGKRIPYWRRTRELACAVGFECIDWWQRDRSRQLTAFNNVRRKQGLPTIDDEDIQVFRRTR